MKTIKILTMLASLALLNVRGEEWRKVAFVGDAKVKSISGLVEVATDESSDKTLHSGDKAKAGQTIRVWRGAELVLWLESSQSFVRAAGPTVVRLIDEKVELKQASIAPEEKNFFVVRSMQGGGKALCNGRWVPVTTGMTLCEGAKVRPYRDSVIDLYNPSTRTALRVTNHTKPTALVAKQDAASILLTAQTR